MAVSRSTVAGISTGHVRAGFPSSSHARRRSSASCSAVAAFSPPLAALATRSARRSIAARSAKTSSSSTVSASSSGSIRPAGWAMDSSWKQRSTCTTASAFRIVPRNWLPRPSPCDAPRTSPAMSTTSSVAGTILPERELATASSASSRGSRTSATPCTVSVVENMCGATAAPPPASALKSVDLPLFGSPTRATSTPAIRRPSPRCR